MKASVDATKKHTDDGASRTPSAAAADGTNDDDGHDYKGDFPMWA